MRFVSFMLAVLILVLSCIPCADAHAATAGESSVNAVTVNASAHNKNAGHHRQDEDDDCSPFCHCSCCASFSIPQGIITIQLHKFTFTQPRYTVHIPAAPVSVSLPVWQPPQLV